MARHKLIISAIMALTIPPLITFPMELRNYHTARDVARYTSEIFSVCGFPRPDDFDTPPGIRHFSGHNDSFFGTNCALALQQHRLKFGITE